MKNCKTCKTALILKETKASSSRSQKAYYYSAYHFCSKCKKMYLDDAFKVINNKMHLFDTADSALSPVDVEIWTDGACSNNGRENAKAAWAFVSGEYEKADLVKGKQSNNTAEALAIYYALEWAAESGYKRIRVSSDSLITLTNLIKPLEKIKANQEIFARIFSLIKQHNLDVSYKKVLGHADDVNNNRADKLANGLVGIK